MTKYWVRLTLGASLAGVVFLGAGALSTTKTVNNAGVLSGTSPKTTIGTSGASPVVPGRIGSKYIGSSASGGPSGINGVTTKSAPGSAIRVGVPISIEIPALTIASKIVELGLTRTGAVMVPATTSVVGWYKYGAEPGAVGASVILGHVDSYTGPGVFFSLDRARAGMKIIVFEAGGIRRVFVVTGVVEYPKSKFPSRLVYRSKGGAELNLVTCGGVFDHATGHYEANIVVFSRLTSS